MRSPSLRVVREDLKIKWFSNTINNKVLAHARLMDGKLLLLPTEVLERYKSLTNIEQGFRLL
ncbi:hypothetical protein [Limnohabitans sp. DM1]|uniref:hypothetical protein n=1 Tax=Limnohabitans sp. DM1 TaxID=1597955 RepID=UPI001892C195|nr:hypothetical protein [Limnohabitans sp. DM1]